jgi:NADPH-dependent curcumin reductase CurA
VARITNHRLVLAKRPLAEVTDDCFEHTTEEVGPVGPHQVLVRTLWLGFEPAQRGWLNDIPSYTPPVALGEVMRAWGVGQVVASNHPQFSEGDMVHGMLGWQEWCLADGDDEAIGLVHVPPEVTEPQHMLGVAGATGLTAYFGMTDIARPVEGDTVLVTAAAGATGSVAGQIARILGAAKVVGTASSEAKREWVRSVAGFDACVDHHDEKVRRRLREEAPDGYNVVFDNVGGSLLDAAIFNIALRGRIALCGAISTGYKPQRPDVGLHYYQLLTTRRARMEGFLLTDYADRFPEARTTLCGWVADGRLRVAEDRLEGLENAAEGLRRLFEGKNLGKQLLHVADPD